LVLTSEVGGNMVATMEVPASQTSAYGILDVDASQGRLMRVRGVVEKPEAGTVPSNLAVIGRYILGPEIFTALDGAATGVGRDPTDRCHRRPNPHQRGPRLPLPRPKVRLRIQGRLPASDHRVRASAGRPTGQPAGVLARTDGRECVRVKAHFVRCRVPSIA
jgi:hypothetical protein